MEQPTGYKITQVKCDYCNEPAVSYGRYKLCSEHSKAYDKMKNSWREYRQARGAFTR